MTFNQKVIPLVFYPDHFIMNPNLIYLYYLVKQDTFLS